MRKARSISEVQRELGRRIQAARVAAGLTQEAAADVAAIDPKRWQRLEAGQVNATVRTLVRVAEAVEVDFWELLAPPAAVEPG